MRRFKGCSDGIHRYEARYDKSEVVLPWDRLKSFKIDPDALEMMRRITYVRDICVRCGHVIERDRLRAVS